MMKRILVFVALMILATTTYAGNWPTLRGPNHNGSSEETNLPANWSRTENVAWKITLPGPSAATPAIWDDHVFVSSSDVENESVRAYCVDRNTGKILWQHEVAKGYKKDYRSTFAAPSPATDGKTVIFFYGTGDLIAYDFAGKKKWSKNIGPFAFGWTFSTSPVIYDNKLIMQVLQRDVAVRGSGKPTGNPSYILALNPANGEEIWRVDRPSKARAESLEAFTTPVPFKSSNRDELLVAGGDCLTGHDVKTGRELWRWGTWNPKRIGHWRLVPSPVGGAGVVLACAPKNEPIFAIKTGGKGVLNDDSIAWSTKDQRTLTSDVPSPAFTDGDFFVLSDKQRSLSRVDPKTGKIKWNITTPGRSKYEASPTVADGKIYIVNFDGVVVVVDAKDGKILREIPMEENLEEDKVRSSVAVAHGQIFIRTTRELFCIGK